MRTAALARRVRRQGQREQLWEAGHSDLKSAACAILGRAETASASCRFAVPLQIGREAEAEVVVVAVVDDVGLGLVAGRCRPSRRRRCAFLKLGGTAATLSLIHI